jgi:hypothetical protein
MMPDVPLAYWDVLGYYWCVRCHDRLSNPAGMTVVLALHVVQGRKCHECGQALVPPKTTQYVTDAPERYDGFGTETVTALPYKTMYGPVRIVSIQDQHLEWQTVRYGSGLYIAYTRERWDHDLDLLIRLQTVTPTDL